jgi:hypothetical protein
MLRPARQPSPVLGGVGPRQVVEPAHATPVGRFCHGLARIIREPEEI